MVGTFRELAEKREIITVGVLGSKNNLPTHKTHPETYAIVADIHARVRFDPSRQMVSGFSGGALVSFNMARRHGFDITAVISMGGWLGRQWGVCDWYEPGLLVVRLTGDTDKGTNHHLQWDRDFLMRHQVLLKDISYKGGHSVPSKNVIDEALNWILGQLPQSSIEDMQKAEAWINNETNRATTPQLNTLLFQRCLTVLEEKPRSCMAFQAQKKIYEFMDNGSMFSQVDVGRLKTRHDFSNYFGFMAYGATMAGNATRFKAAYSCLYSLNWKQPDWFKDMILIELFSPNSDKVDIKDALNRIKTAAGKHKDDGVLSLLLTAAFFKEGDKVSAKAQYSLIDKTSIPKKFLTAYENIGKAIKSDGTLNHEVWLKCIAGL
ncbi:MAG: hypothetical protein PHR77_06100 [Kiritimatiellae bacterium]|nr:hypothetical protein [Kiritimatiellia bacterium]